MVQSDLKKMKIGVLGGGISSEREISLKSAIEIDTSLNRQGYNCVFIDIKDTDKDALRSILFDNGIEIAFIALHGKFGEDGGIQQYLSEFGIPYTGSGPFASHLSMNKITSKLAFGSAGVPTAGFSIWEAGRRIPDIKKYPVVIKPYFSGSSFGVNIVHDRASLDAALYSALEYSSKILIEDYVKGRELTAGVLGNRVLDVVEIIPAKNKYFDYNSKYIHDGAVFNVPADLDKMTERKVKEIAFLAHSVVKCKNFSRVDMILSTENNVPYVLEINSVPGFTEHSLLPLSARSAGIGFDELVVKILELTLYG
ncbi:MAG: D-alanine--D-alanine ligase [Candidatus Omnitrophica bacterium]|nr:D-alanine--D-alanine ligase [Candidatus Omnitrophota bacterium]